jgi:hypothetical protein
MTDNTSDEEAVFMHDPEAFALTHDTNPSGIPSVVITFDPDADTQARYRIPLEAVRDITLELTAWLEANDPGQ